MGDTTGMNKASKLNDDGVSMPIDDSDNLTQQRFYAGDIIYTEGMTSSHMYVIKEGEVDFYVVREEKRVIVRSLGKGQCFGMDSSLLNNGRASNAIAASYSEFYIADGASLESYLGGTPKLIRAILTTLAIRLETLGELIATRVNYQPETLVYAQLLQILGQAELGVPKAYGRAASDKPVVVSVLLAEFFNQVRVILGHSDFHFRNTLGKLLRQHLVQLQDEGGSGKRIVFSPKDIVLLAKKLAVDDKEQSKVDHEYVSIKEFADIVDVESAALLSKLARNEFSEDVFTFRKSEIMRLLDTKGKRFFSERKIKTPNEFTEIEDIEFADLKSIFTVLSPIDSYDLAKVISQMESDKAKEKMLNCLPRAKRTELESDLSSMGSVDAIEAQQIGQRIIARVKEVMLGRA